MSGEVQGRIAGNEMVSESRSCFKTLGSRRVISDQTTQEFPRSRPTPRFFISPSTFFDPRGSIGNPRVEEESDHRSLEMER